MILADSKTQITNQLLRDLPRFADSPAPPPERGERLSRRMKLPDVRWLEVPFLQRGENLPHSSGADGIQLFEI
jgi:hypothetical protein